MDISIRAATNDDLEAITELLIECNLPINDLEKFLLNFVVATTESQVCGCAGSESYFPFALVRSLAVSPSRRNLGVANKLIEELLHQLRTQGIQQVFALTTTAETYLHRIGFSRSDTGAVPQDMLKSGQFQGICPESAVLLVKTLST